MWTLFYQILFMYIVHFKCSEDKPAILMTNRDGLFKLQAGSWNMTQIPTIKSVYNQVELDYENDFVYVEKVNNIIYRIKIKNEDEAEQKSIVNGTADVISMAFDWVHKKLYWLDVVMLKKPLNALHVMEPNGDNAKTLTQWTTYPKYGSSMILDPYKKYVYCATDWDIHRIGMDGTDRKDIMYLGGKYFTIDLINQQLYFMNHYGLSYYDLDTKEITDGLTKYYDVKPLVWFLGNIFIPVKRVTNRKDDYYVIRYNIQSRNVRNLWWTQDFL